MNFGWVQELKKNRYIPVHDEAWTSKNCSTFGELADRFIDSVLYQGRSYDRIDIVFDRYRVNSIKESTIILRTQNLKLVWKSDINWSVRY